MNVELVEVETAHYGSQLQLNYDASQIVKSRMKL
jgi:hypothetical protein